ncbi:MAG TPA: histidine phosphatase family protein [Actinomycetota bacterium]|nr:histidine phosphatase family protein [Actinomycetota bacterium]
MGRQDAPGAPPRTVIGIRHGEVHNPDGVIYSGLPGFGLSELGRSQARAVGEALAGAGIAALYASPLDRAMETAAFIAAATGAEVVPDERLHEWRHWAQFAGMTWEELRTNGPEAWHAYVNDPGSVTSGESLAELADRVEAWERDAVSTHADGLIVAVSHLEPLRALLLRKLDRPANDLFYIQIGLGEAVRLAPEASPSSLTPDALKTAGV